MKKGAQPPPASRLPGDSALDAAFLAGGESKRNGRGGGGTVALGFLFFSICLGLGYPTLNRYDPRGVAGLADSGHYAALVTSWRLPPAIGRQHSHRILVPYVAKPFYWLAVNRVGSWDPVQFGLLVANSIFCAATALLLVAVGKRLGGNAAASRMAGLVYLSSFAVSNLHLSGLVDSGECCAFMALIYCFVSRRFASLPIIGILGALDKETFIPLAGVFALTWCAFEDRRFRSRAVAWVIAAFASGLVATTAAQSLMWGKVVGPWAFIELNLGGLDFRGALVDAALSRENLYVFGAIVPLGVWRLRFLPARWILAAFSASGAALMFAALNGAGGNAARPMFGAAGPLFCLSTALLISEAAPRGKRAVEEQAGDLDHGE